MLRTTRIVFCYISILRKLYFVSGIYANYKIITDFHAGQLLSRTFLTVLRVGAGLTADKQRAEISALPDVTDNRGAIDQLPLSFSTQHLPPKDAPDY